MRITRESAEPDNHLLGEALALEWQHIELATGTLRVVRSKTDAGARTVDLTPALRDDLIRLKADSKWTRPTDMVFATRNGRPTNRHNVRQRVLLPAIEAANPKLEKQGIAPIAKVGLHGLRRTYASLRAAAGDDPAYTVAQLGHEDPTFTLRTYTHAAKRRPRLTGTHRKAYDRALEWAQMGTNDAMTADTLQKAAA